MAERNTILKLLILLVIIISLTHLLIFFFWEVISLSQYSVEIQQKNNILNFSITKNKRELLMQYIQIVLSSEFLDIFIDINELNISNSTSFQLPFYFTGNYTVRIYYKNEKIYDRNLKFNFNFSEIQNEQNFTTLSCHSTSFKYNWCEAQNVCIFAKKIIFTSPYKILFKDNFINPSAHPPPYHREEFIIGRQNIKTRKNSNNSIQQWPNATGILSSRYFNHGMLWHNLMDFIVPSYAALHESSFSEQEKENCQLLVYDNDGKFGLFYAKPICPKNDIIYDNVYPQKCYKNFIFGPIKHSGPTNESRIKLNYNINHNQILGMREKFLAQTNKTKCLPNKENPKIAIISRKQEKGKEPKRQIINIDEIVNETISLCPKCRVEVVDFQKMNKMQQVEYACDISLLIGIHGSGLVHGLWMHETTEKIKTGMIEILPYMYTCRNWYEKLSKSANIKYQAIHTLNINQSKWPQWHDSEKVKRCHSDPSLCTKGSCHDFLRDQSVIVDLKQYRNTIQPIINEILQN